MAAVCFVCKKTIDEGTIVSACGKTYHPSHFSCKSCGEALYQKDYIEIRKNPYCLGCSTAMGVVKSIKCDVCQREIHGKVVSVGDKKLHPDCFTCCMCGEPFVSNNYIEKDGKYYCKKDYTESVGLICDCCGYAIEGKYKSVVGGKYHPHCFICSVCGCALDELFYVFDGKLFCKDHRHRNIGYKCGGCGELIDREDTNIKVALGKKWHADHFRCFNCNEKLYETSAKSFLNHEYCPVCYENVAVYPYLKAKY
ncbi:Lim domain [Entamoeba marina]